MATDPEDDVGDLSLAGQLIQKVTKNSTGELKKSYLPSFALLSDKEQNLMPNAMTREELQAHLDAQQARMEAMLARQSADADRHLSRFEARLDQSLQQIHQDRQDQKEDARSTRNTVIGSALAILLSLFGAVYAIQSMNSSIIGNVITAFESGKASAQDSADKPANSASSPSSK